MPDAGYVKPFPGSQQLGVSIPAENLLYQISYDSAQFELPFNAPDHIHFVWNMQLHSESEKHYQQVFVHYLPDHSPNHILHMVFPKPGEWVCHLFAKQVNNSESDQKQKHHQSIFEHTHLLIIFPFHRSLNLSGQPLSCKLKVYTSSDFKSWQALFHTYNTILQPTIGENSGMMPM